MTSISSSMSDTPELASSFSTFRSSSSPLTVMLTLECRSDSSMTNSDPVSPSGTENEPTPFKMDGSEWVLSPLQFLQNTRPIISAHFDKLFPSNADAAATCWKQRYFVFDLENGTLWLFKSDEKSAAAPMTSLPTTSVRGFTDVDQHLCLQFSGKAASKEGNLVPKTWTLRCEDRLIYETWLATTKSTLARYAESKSSPPLEIRLPPRPVKLQLAQRGQDTLAPARSFRSTWLGGSDGSLRSRPVSAVSRSVSSLGIAATDEPTRNNSPSIMTRSGSSMSAPVPTIDKVSRNSSEERRQVNMRTAWNKNVKSGFAKLTNLFRFTPRHQN